MIIKQVSIVYDFVFVTHLPSFYKTNLYNELAKQYKIFVIFVGSGSQMRASDFTTETKFFDYQILNTGAFEQRAKLISSCAAINILRKIRYRQLVLGGWELPEFWVLAWCFTKNKNYLALESSVFESKTKGLRRLIKQFFLMRMKGVYYSGIPHLELLNTLSYSGLTIKTGGVGLMHMPSIHNVRHIRENAVEKPTRFLYVGRLSSEKNLEFIIEYFNKKTRYHLTIVGDGPLKEGLIKKSGKNITFKGHVPNHELQQIYEAHDVFVLPSLKEPWGLVVEEALYHGLPVIASHHVGARQDMIDFYQVGRGFDPLSESSFDQAVEWMDVNFSKARSNIQNIDFTKRAAFQVNSYSIGLEQHA